MMEWREKNEDVESGGVKKEGSSDE